MDSLPTQWLPLVAVVFLLGLKHGLDPDHLAAIDGVTRFNALARPRLARWSGLLFSVGHGTVVTATAVAVATLASGWSVPGWLDELGSWISISFLLALGVANVAAVLRTPRDERVRPAGLRSHVLRRLTETRHPILIAAVGAAFAVSFDTLGSAVLFSASGSSLAGWAFATALGLVFTLGMIATDAVNGLWISQLLARADQRAALASRVMGLAIALLSFVIAGLGIARQLHPALEARLDGWSTALGLTVIAAIALAFALAMRGARGSPRRAA
jgi:high-affinity nickel-transport protein